MYEGNLAFIVNPASCRGRTAALWPGIRHSLGVAGAKFDEYVTNSPGHAVAIAGSLEPDQYTGVVCVGGDGTTHEVVEGLGQRWLCGKREARIPFHLGIVPTGSGNDLARSLGLTPGSTAIGHVLDGSLLEIDLGQVGESYFINVSGAGFDAEVVSRFNTKVLGFRVRGSIGYLTAVVATLSSFRGMPLEIKLDGKAFHSHALLIAVGNGRYYGGGMKITPLADPSDGMLDVCWVESMPTVAFLASLMSVFAGKHLDNPRVHSGRARVVEVYTSVARARVQADGELVGELPTRWAVVRNAITVMVPTSRSTGPLALAYEQRKGGRI